MHFLVIGGTGVIGYKIVEYLNQKKEKVNYTFFKNSITNKNAHFLDVTDHKKTSELIQNLKPDIVINSSAISNIDLCETDKKMAESINVEGTQNIVDACKKINSKIIFISTSFVFDGKKKYSEEDPLTPSTFYGITKAKGEEIIKKSKLPNLILRTDQPYCWIEKWQHTNSVLRVIERLKDRQFHKEVIDWNNVPTYVPNFVEVMKKLIDLQEKGIFHLVGSDYIDRYEWALKTAEIFKLDKKLIKPIESRELNLAVKRVNGNLSNQKVTRITGMKMMGIVEGLTSMYKQS